jgi:hypothetical protein
MACKRVDTIQVDGRMTIIAETKDHVLFANSRYVGQCSGKTLYVAPTASDDVRKAVEMYAERQGWVVA